MALEWNLGTFARPHPIITTLDVHAGGEPLRIITSGLPDIPGATMLERRRWLQTHLDTIRTMLMWEPRGHFNMYGCALVPPVSEEADLGVLFFHNEGYSTMCGHGVIALVTALLETDALTSRRDVNAVTLDTPAGLVRATAIRSADGTVERVSFVNVPSFVLARDLVVELPHVGPLTVDVAFGGAFYAIVAAEQVGLTVEPRALAQLADLGEATKRAVSAVLPITHPTEPELGYLYGTIFTGPPEDPAHHSRNVCVFADAEVDRSPTGTGVSARLAVHAARGEIAPGEELRIESILGAASVFTGRIIEHTVVGTVPAIVPEVSGVAYITGRHEFVLNPHDPLSSGFLLR